MRVSRHTVAEKVPQATLGSDSPVTQPVTTNTHPSTLGTPCQAGLG